MAETAANLATRLEQRFSNELIDCLCDHCQVTMILPAEQILPVSRTLCEDPEFAFAQLSDLCGVDYLSYGDSDWETTASTSTGFSRGLENARHKGPKTVQRFAVVYHLLSLTHNIRLRIRCFLDDDNPRIASVTPIWNSADWFEREAFDLFGILFEGHPDLRRILTDYGFVGHPFRKDFPLEGNVEVRYDPDQQRVVYQPVTITNRVLVPRVIRADNRYIKPEE